MLDITLPLIIFLFPLAYSPGPGNLFFAAIGARSGAFASLHASAGYHVATWIVTFAVGFGFAGFVTRFPLAFTIIKYAGSAYVLWLAWKFFRAGISQAKAETRSATFADGAVLLILNPKAYLIIALMFTQFLPPTATNFTQLVFYITTIFTLNNLLAFFIWALLGDALSRLFREERQARTINMTFAVLLVVIAIWMGVK
jgi:threonine/homoserine/homoserine lactone efflux protein